MENVKYHTEQLIAALKESKSYQRYMKVKKELEKNPELKHQLDEFRRKNYLMQTENLPEDLFEEAQKMTKEYKEFRQNEMIEEYLESELDICKNIQRVIQTIMVSIDIDIDEFADEIKL